MEFGGDLRDGGVEDGGGEGAAAGDEAVEDGGQDLLVHRPLHGAVGVVGPVEGDQVVSGGLLVGEGVREGLDDRSGAESGDE